MTVIEYYATTKYDTTKICHSISVAYYGTEILFESKDWQLKLNN